MVGVVSLQIAGAQFLSDRLDDLRQGFRAVAWGDLYRGVLHQMLFAGCGGRVDRLAELIGEPDVLKKRSATRSKARGRGTDPGS